MVWGLLVFVVFFFLNQNAFCKVSVVEREYDLKNVYEDNVVEWSYESMLVFTRNAVVFFPEEVKEIEKKESQKVQGRQPFSLSIKMSVKEPVRDEMPKEATNVEEVTLNETCTDEIVVYFDFDKSELPKKQHQLLVEKVRKLKEKCKGVLSASVRGYACPIGSKKYNKKLSTLRAENVADILRSEGVEVTKVVGLGEINDREDVFCLNRKVVVEIKEVK